MTLTHLIIAIATPILLACIWQLMRERRTYRAKWITAMEWYFSKVDECRNAKGERVVARLNEKYALETCVKLNARCAAQSKVITELSVSHDALMHGDRRCVDGHRYYTGMGIQCPFCGAQEAAAGVFMVDEVEQGRMRAGWSIKDVRQEREE